MLGDGLELVFSSFLSLSPLIVDAIGGLEMLCAGIGIGGVGIPLGVADNTMHLFAGEKSVPMRESACESVNPSLK